MSGASSDDSEQVQARIARNERIEDEDLFFARTVYVWRGSGGLFGCRIRYSADPAIFASRAKDDTGHWLIPVSDCIITHVEPGKGNGLNYRNDGSLAVG